MKPTEENHSPQSPSEECIKRPDGAYILSRLIDLFAKQEGVDITYHVKDDDGKMLTVTTGKPYTGKKWTYINAERG